MSKPLTKEHFQKLATERNHSLLDFSKYEHIRSPIELYCHNCYTRFTTTAHSYKNAKKTGCPGCKKILISALKTGNVPSTETRRKIGEKASLRPGSLSGVTGKDHPSFKDGKGRDMISPSNEDYAWKNAVRKAYNGKCALTGISGDTHRCCSHHLNAYGAYPEQRFLVSNGVYLSYEVHNQFHCLYKFGGNTEEEFIDFCDKYYGINWLEIKKN